MVKMQLRLSRDQVLIILAALAAWADTESHKMGAGLALQTAKWLDWKAGKLWGNGWETASDNERNGG
jgi:hypothetical protein